MGLIDATKAIESIDEIACSVSVCISSDYRYGMIAMKDAAIHAIEEQPTVDAVPVVRCGECKYWEEESTFCLNKEGCYGSETTADWFCADGERRSDD